MAAEMLLFLCGSRRQKNFPAMHKKKRYTKSQLQSYFGRNFEDLRVHILLFFKKYFLVQVMFYTELLNCITLQLCYASVVHSVFVCRLKHLPLSPNSAWEGIVTYTKRSQAQWDTQMLSQREASSYDRHRVWQFQL